MQFQTRLQKTVVVSPDTGRLARACVSLEYPVLEGSDAPVAMKLGKTEFRIFDGRLVEPLQIERYASPDWALQCMANNILGPYLTDAQGRELSNRTHGNLAGPNITFSEIGEILRAAARRHPVIDGRQYAPSPGPVLAVEYVRNLFWRGPQHFTLAWTTYDRHFGSNLFTYDQIEEAVTFADTLESEQESRVPPADKLASELTVVTAVRPPSLRDMLLWRFAVQELDYASNTPIHDLGRQGLIAVRNLQPELERRRDKSLVNQEAHDREAYLRHFDVDGLEDFLGPVVHARADAMINHGDPAWYFEARHTQSTLQLLAPGYRRPTPAIEDPELFVGLEKLRLADQRSNKHLNFVPSTSPALQATFS